MANAVCGYDFTCFDTDLEKTKALLKTYCKQWVFQEEEAPTTGRRHYQGRFSLKVKERITTLSKKLPGWHLSQTLKDSVGTDFYVTKEETRKAGPWSSNDVETYVPRQIQEVEKLRPWQQHIVDDRNVWDKRTINIIIDNTGNNGKTTLCTYCGVYNLGRKIPFSNDFRDMMRMVMDTPTSKLYLFDIPRALKKEHLYQFFAGIEEIKNGYAFDDRYAFREKYFDCPNIWIFMNVKPDESQLSRDRWKYWEIVNDKLVPYGTPKEFSDEIPELPEEWPEDWFENKECERCEHPTCLGHESDDKKEFDITSEFDNIDDA